MATLFPVICTATVTNASKLVTVTGTDQSTGLPPVLSDLNCRPNGTVFIAGVGYLVGERLSTTTFNVERNYEGINASGLSCTIGVFTPEMANRAELATQLREYSALVALLREDWNGLVYTLISPTGAADPGSGNLAFNHATPASITGMYMDVNDARGRTVAGQVMTWRQGTQVRTQSLATGAFITVELAATPTNQGPDEWISNDGLSIVESYGTLAPGEKVAVIYIPSSAGLDPDYTVELLAGRAAYDGAAAGIQVLVNDVGDGRAAIYTKLSATSADWSTAAYVTGGVGPQGNKGWSPQLVGMSDGARRVLKLAGYVGGAGSAPTANVGEYLKADGTFTATIGDAVDVRGPSGTAGIAGGGVKGIACRVVITANVNLAGGGIAAGTTHEGVTLDANDLVLVAGQTAPAENGAYPAPAAGAATRHTDFDAWDELVAAYFPVSEGTVYADTLWRCTSNKGGTLDTTALVFGEFSVSRVGMIADFAGTTAPSGWLFCYGQNVSRTTYATLFAVLSTTFGVGDGSTTFGLPDLRGRVIAGKDDMGGTSANRLTNQSGGLNGDTLGATGGAETHTLLTAQMPAHKHTVGSGGTSYVFYPGSGGSAELPLGGINTTNAGAMDNTGGGGAHNNIQPTFVLNKIIFAGV